MSVPLSYNPMLTADPSMTIRRQFLEKEGGPVEFLFEAYDEFIRSLDEILRGEFPTNNGRFIVRNFRWTPPQTTIGSDNQVVDLYPAQCLQQSIGYFINAYLELVNEVNGVEVEKKDVWIGKIPVMVGSKQDNLTRDKSGDLHGSLPNDPGGYYIIGSEKVVMLQTQLLPHQDVIYSDKNLGNFMICRDGYSTKKMGIVIYEKLKTPNDKTTQTQILHLTTSSLGPVNKGDKTPGLNLGTVFKLFGFSSTDALDYLDNFLPKNFKNRAVVSAVVREFFQKTFDFSIQNEQDAEHSLATRDKTTITLYNSGRHSEAISVSRANLMNDLYPQIREQTQKVAMLSYMSMRLALVYKGFLPMDDRDNYKNVHLKTSPSMMSTLVSQIWREASKQIRNKINNQQAQNVAINIGTIIEVIANHSTLTEPLTNAITTGKWGNKTSRASWTSITQELSRMSMSATISDLTKINTPSVKRGSQVKARQVHGSHAFMKCIAQTPDTEAVGLVTNLGSLAKVSIDRANDEIVIEQILNELPDIFSNDIVIPGENQHLIILNGRPIGWGKGEMVKSHLIQLRRINQISYDVGISLTPFALFIKTIAGRLYAPALIVQPPENGEAIGKLMYDIIAEQLRRAPTFDELLTMGGVEYIDSHELETAVIAETIELYRQRVADQEGMRRELREINRELGILSGTRSTRASHPLPNEDIVAEQLKVNGRPNDRLNVLVAMRDIVLDRLERLRLSSQFTHTVLDPTSIYGVAAGTIPRPDMMQGPRIGFQCQMGGQAISTSDINFDTRYDNDTKSLVYGQAPLFYTQQSQDIGNDELLTGQHLILAICPWAGYNVEDAIIFNKSSIDRGLFLQENTFAIKESEERVNGIVKMFYRPLPEENDRNDVYRLLDNDGIVQAGVWIKEGDCLIGMCRSLESNQSNVTAYLQQVEKIHEIRDQINDLLNNPDHQPEVADLRQQLQVLITTNPEGQQYFELKSLKEKQNRLQQQLSQVGNRERDEERLRELESQIAERSSLLKEVQNIYLQDPQYRSLYDELSTLRTERDRLRRESDTFTGTITEARDFRTQLDVINQQIKEATQRLFEAEPNTEDIIALRQQIAKFPIRSLQYEVNSLKQRLQLPLETEIRAQLRTLKTQINELEVDLEMTRQEHLQKIKDVKKQIAENTSTMALKEKIRRLESDYHREREILDRLPNPPDKIHVYANWDQSGVIDSVQVSRVESSLHRMVKIRVRNLHKPSSGFGGGDKFAPRCAQKMTVSRTYNQEDMPFCNIVSGYVDGEPIFTTLTPDALINPTCIPSRMTVSLLLELVTGNLNALHGTRTDATAYRYFDPNDFITELVKYGFEINGNAFMTNPFTGERMKASIAIGPVHYQALKHQVEDKIRVRGGEGPHNPKTGQPLRGRKYGGGIRLGEMERDCILSLGASMSLNERMSSDAIETVWCKNCGIRVGPSMSAEAGFECRNCHGTNFGKLLIPAAYDYMIQLLMGIGVKAQLTFEENVRGRYNFATKPDPVVPTVEETCELPSFNYLQTALTELQQEWQTLSLADTLPIGSRDEDEDYDDDQDEYDDDYGTR
jgi:DNA-directed RNA polymerase beta subunit